MNIRKTVLKYHKETGRVPDLNIIFCGNRAVVSANKRTENGEEHPTGHITIDFGPFLFYRIGKAIKKCYRDNYK